MIRMLALFLPALFPSWRFFPAVEPSPRIEVAHVGAGPAEAWRAFRPPPARLTAAQMIARLFWSPRRNEDLYLASCAERIIADGRDHARREILKRIRAATPEARGRALRFRLVTVHREGERLVERTVYVSPIDAPAGDPPEPAS
ncbi:hypothetical protein [Rubrimonas cliftonensis]|nr:hypothetical protein [Rubrimonas cliftonensis]